MDIVQLLHPGVEMLNNDADRKALFMTRSRNLLEICELLLGLPARPGSAAFCSRNAGYKREAPSSSDSGKGHLYFAYFTEE